MRIAVISASNKQPEWIRNGFSDYAKRLRGRYRLELKEIPLPRRGRSASIERLLDVEGDRMLAAVPGSAHVVALDERGSAWTTLELASRLERWLEGGAPVALLIGGPDGLGPGCLERSAERWSLSTLTLPHGLVRIIVAEALYRASSVLSGHPYHRA